MYLIYSVYIYNIYDMYIHIYVKRTSSGACGGAAPPVRAPVSRCGFRVWGLGFRVWGQGFGVVGSGFGVWGLGFEVWGWGFRVWV